MLDVYFKSDQEVICFCENLFKKIKLIELNWKTDKEWGNHIQFKQKLSSEHLQEIADSMVHVFFVFRLSRMIKQVIQKYYFYTNIYEIERICEIAYGALSGEDKEAFKLIDRHKEMEPKSSLYSLFMTNIKSSKVIHFDSIIQFQLNSFKERLVYDVGLAIDEFKREEDHQA
ncbi:sporulation protein YtxC, partial [Virgibacillus sp. W0430]|uniref:sporulation protein YtxC n=1 Tax=Virgibacillus sp. W0430 TaxID=3391580 RepID=UPI003F45FAE9